MSLSIMPLPYRMQRLQHKYGGGEGRSNLNITFGKFHQQIKLTIEEDDSQDENLVFALKGTLRLPLCAFWGDIKVGEGENASSCLRP